MRYTWFVVLLFVGCGSDFDDGSEDIEDIEDAGVVVEDSATEEPYTCPSEECTSADDALKECFDEVIGRDCFCLDADGSIDERWIWRCPDL